MDDNAPCNDHKSSLLLAGTLTLLILLLIYLVTLRLPSPAMAQGNTLGLKITKSLEGNSTVRVGQLLEFTIRITNTSTTIPITSLVVLDGFESSIVSPSGLPPYGKPDDPPLSEPPGILIDSGTISFTLLAPGQQLAAGQSTVIKVRLRAVHPTSDITTVNRARIAQAIEGMVQKGLFPLDSLGREFKRGMPRLLPFFFKR